MNRQGISPRLRQCGHLFGDIDFLVVANVALEFSDQTTVQVNFRILIVMDTQRHFAGDRLEPE